MESGLGRLAYETDVKFFNDVYVKYGPFACTDAELKAKGIFVGARLEFPTITALRGFSIRDSDGLRIVSGVRSFGAPSIREFRYFFPVYKDDVFCRVLSLKGGSQKHIWVGNMVSQEVDIPVGNYMFRGNHLYYLDGVINPVQYECTLITNVPKITFEVVFPSSSEGVMVGMLFFDINGCVVYWENKPWFDAEIQSLEYDQEFGHFCYASGMCSHIAEGLTLEKGDLVNVYPGEIPTVFEKKGGYNDCRAVVRSFGQVTNFMLELSELLKRIDTALKGRRIPYVFVPVIDQVDLKTFTADADCLDEGKMSILIGHLDKIDQNRTAQFLLEIRGLPLNEAVKIGERRVKQLIFMFKYTEEEWSSVRQVNYKIYPMKVSVNEPILDFGCGDGIISTESGLVPEDVIVLVDEKDVRSKKTKKYEFHLADDFIEDNTLCRGFFKHVYLRNVLHHVKEGMHKIIGAVRKKMRDDGLLYVVDHDCDNRAFAAALDYHHWLFSDVQGGDHTGKYFSASDMIDYISSFGFKLSKFSKFKSVIGTVMAIFMKTNPKIILYSPGPEDLDVSKYDDGALKVVFKDYRYKTLFNGRLSAKCDSEFLLRVIRVRGRECFVGVDFRKEVNEFILRDGDKVTKSQMVRMLKDLAEQGLLKLMANGKYIYNGR